MIEGSSYDDAPDENDFSSDSRYFYLATIETDMNTDEFEKYLLKNLSFYDVC